MRRAPTKTLLAMAFLAVSPWAVALYAADEGGELAPATADRAMRACVKVIVPLDALPGQGSSGSGTLVDREGFIVTNFHCVGRREGDDNPIFVDAGIQVGEYYNADRSAVIAISDSWSKPPKPAYRARVIEGDPKRDIAILKIVESASDTKRPLPAVLPMEPLLLGDSEAVRPGSWVYVLGYPSVGGDTITITDGKIAGFLDEDGKPPNVDWLKTTAEIHHGNSGGTAIERSGRLIGIPTEGRGEVGDQMKYLRAVNLAAPLLATARRTWRTRLAERPTGKPAPSPAGPAAAPKIGPLRFGSGWDDEKGLTGVGTVFPAGTKQVWADFKFENIRNGSPWRYEWHRDGRFDTGAKDLRWAQGASGTHGVGINNEEGVIPGRYRLKLFVGDALLREGDMVVEGDGAAVPAPAPAVEKATLAGVVLDRATKKPIQGAVVIVLKERRTVKEWAEEDGLIGPSVLVHGTSDAEGRFVLPDAIPRGPKYSMVVLAPGYQPAFGDAALDSTREGVLAMEVKLDRDE